MDFSAQRITGSLQNLDINFNKDGWGPVGGEKSSSFFGIPYAHFDKKDKIGRPADFTVQGSSAFPRQHFQKRREEHGATDFSYRYDAVEDSTFQLVDTTKAGSKTKHTAKRQVNRMQQGGRGGRGRGGQASGGRGQPGQDYYSQGGGRGRMAMMRGKAGGFRGRRPDRKQDRTPSLSVGADWVAVEEFDLVQLNKLVANAPQVEDLEWCGHLDQYDDSYEKITTKSARTLRRSENKLFYSVTSSEDPVLEKFAVEGKGDVFATDSILAQLMAAPRSVYSWDILVQKVNGMIFLDKRDDSNFDLLTVSETAPDPPVVSEEAEEINHPERLSVEATMVNQNFSQQILTDNDLDRKKFDSPNPFFDETQPGLESASVAYRYRKFNLGSIRLVARCELHCWTLRHNEEEYVTSHAFNEWDSRYSGGVNWRQKIDQQRGAVLATELKNNSAKIAKWTAQAILAGAHQMKIGYVSRAAVNTPTDHTILATQVFKPKDLSTQINLSLTNIWGIIKMICELLMSKPDGKYVIMKDPNKPIMRVYSIPLDSFEEEDEDDLLDEEDDEDAEDISPIPTA